MKTQKTWTPTETAVIYHLLLLGYNNNEVQGLCDNFEAGSLFNRTADSIGAKCSEVRKWISKQKGYVVSHYDISERVHNVILKASRLEATDFVKLQTPAMVRQFIPMVVKAGTPVIVAPPQVCTPLIKPKFFRCEPTPDIYNRQPSDQNNIIDVMRMAKELGAVEVEYSGVKIKF